MAALDARTVPGAILIGILAAAIAGMALGLSTFGGVVSLPPSIAPVFLKLDLAKALEIGLVAIVFTFFFVDVFDNTGTLVGVAHKAGLMQSRRHAAARQARADRRLRRPPWSAPRSAPRRPRATSRAPPA